MSIDPLKAIILAAGKGSRLGQYTKNLPKGMLSFQGSSLIERQVDTLRASGIEDISIVRGYMPEKIKIDGVKYYDNVAYAETNMVASLFCAEQELEGEVLICYADIVYAPAVLEQIKESKAEIGLVVDTDYLEDRRARLDDWMNDLEILELAEDGRILELGRPTRDLKLAKVRYVGLLKFTEIGLVALKREFKKNKQQYWDSAEPWFNSKSFKQAYMTDMIQVLINTGNEVRAIPINRNWLEFDTEEDYQKALSWAKDGSLERFISLEL